MCSAQGFGRERVCGYEGALASTKPTITSQAISMKRFKLTSSAAIGSRVDDFRVRRQPDDRCFWSLWIRYELPKRARPSIADKGHAEGLFRDDPSIRPDSERC